MTSTHRKLLVAGGVLAVALAYLGYAGAKKGWVYYVPVDEYVTDVQMQKQRVRLMGRVAGEGLEVNGAGLTARFDLLGPKSRVRVNYHGSIPDLFKAGSDVVVEGRMGSDGRFEADILMTKCASKYDSAHGAKEMSK